MVVLGTDPECVTRAAGRRVWYGASTLTQSVSQHYGQTPLGLDLGWDAPWRRKIGEDEVKKKRTIG